MITMRRGNRLSLVLVLAACAPNVELDEGSFLTCDKTEQCLEGQLCDVTVGLCVDEGSSLDEPCRKTLEGKVVALPQVGGLHHRYERRAA